MCNTLAMFSHNYSTPPQSPEGGVEKKIPVSPPSGSWEGVIGVVWMNGF
jgi:hypothetical protein